MKKPGHRYFHLDVFGESKYSGNQLAVVLPESRITPAGMQAIAREFNFPETTFIQSNTAKRGAWPVRIFTPFREVPFAGHPTLGTAYAIREFLARGKPAEIVLDLKIGRIPVGFQDGSEGVIWMRQNAPAFGSVHSRAAVAGMLGLTAKDVDPRFPAQEVSTGFNWLLVPLKNLDAVKRARMDLAACEAHFRKPPEAVPPIFLFSPETYTRESRINSRSFAPQFGVPEDPATGSANGNLAGWLSRHRYFGSDSVDISVEQGWEMGRKSRLHLRAESGSKGITVEVGGRVFEVAEGRLR